MGVTGPFGRYAPERGPILLTLRFIDPDPETKLQHRHRRRRDSIDSVWPIRVGLKGAYPEIPNLDREAEF
jgi:hypothetical protein